MRAHAEGYVAILDELVPTLQQGFKMPFLSPNQQRQSAEDFLNE